MSNQMYKNLLLFFLALLPSVLMGQQASDYKAQLQKDFQAKQKILAKGGVFKVFDK